MNQLELNTWNLFVKRCTELCSLFLTTDHAGHPTFEGKQETDGHSMDWLFDQFKLKKSPQDVFISVQKNKGIL